MEIKRVKQAVVLAGGLGTRLKPFTDTDPKPMYPFKNIPFIEYLVKQIKGFGIDKILILLGYLPDKVMDHLGNGDRYGVSIKYLITPVGFDTGARLRDAFIGGSLEDEFLLMYCDNYCPIDFNRLCREYAANMAEIQLTIYSNKDKYTHDNIRIAGNGRVEVYDKTRTAEGLQGVDIGYAIVNKDVFKRLPEGNVNFEKAIYPQLVERNSLFATVTEHRYYSVGSFERIELTEQFLSGKKYIFLDRDGTLNVRPPKAHYIETEEDFIWLPGAREAVKKLNDAGYKIILVTNQPGIAKGSLTQEGLDKIHDKMQADLKEIGAHIDHIYCCPHDWDEGCECRKPKPGMLYQAQKEYSIDLTKCWMLGDDERDMQAGGSAGCKCMYISEQHPLMEAVSHIIALEGDQ